MNNEIKPNIYLSEGKFHAGYRIAIYDNNPTFKEIRSKCAVVAHVLGINIDNCKLITSFDYDDMEFFIISGERLATQEEYEHLKQLLIEDKKRQINNNQRTIEVLTQHIDELQKEIKEGIVRL